MKKIIFGLLLVAGTFTFAQQYPNNGWGDDSYYGNNDGYDDYDQNNFPDDYYYNYPQNYYPQEYYQSYYNDYRNSVININWNSFFQQNRLSRAQIDQILYLNNLYSSFSSWNNFYQNNPDRWYYDRFYAMERILGPRVFVIFQNNYYQGHRPTVYFQNYRRTYYVPRYAVMPRYRNVNVNVYRVDRSQFRRQDNPSFKVFTSAKNNGFRDGGVKANSNNGFRNPSRVSQINSSLGNSNIGVRNPNNGGRGNSNNGGFRNGGVNHPRQETPKVVNNSTRGNNGFRNQSRNEKSAPRIQNSGPRQQHNNGQVKAGGFR